MTRDPVIGIDVFLYEAVAALDAVLPRGTALCQLVFLTLHIMLQNERGKPPRQSVLDELQRLFAEAVDEAESRQSKSALKAG